MSIAQRCEITKKRGRGKEHRIKRYLAWKWMADQVIYQRTISGSTYIQSLRCVMHSDTATAKTFFFTPPFTLYIYRYYQIFRSRIIDVNNIPFFYSWAIICNVSLELLNKNRYYIHRVISADFRFVRVVANDSNICG
jgi:hypothetical protein